MTSRRAEGGAGHMVAHEKTFSPINTAISASLQDPSPPVNSSVQDVKQTVDLRKQSTSVWSSPIMCSPYP